MNKPHEQCRDQTAKHRHTQTLEAHHPSSRYVLFGLPKIKCELIVILTSFFNRLDVGALAGLSIVSIEGKERKGEETERKVCHCCC